MYISFWRPPSWISGGYRRQAIPEVAPLKSLTQKHGDSRWNFVAMCYRTLDMPGGEIPTAAGKRRKKLLLGQGLNFV